MAVVSISKIQLRRGLKNSSSGVPQLSSAEMAWAIDTQQLYIGNGAVSEGAPAVGNTEILTEHSDILNLVDLYTYKSLDSNVVTGDTPVTRTLQERLDDRVSIRAFGAYGDGTDQTDEIQRAIFQLFLNDASKLNYSSRVILYMEPGTYRISSTIYIPPFTTILGAGKDKTHIISTVAGPTFYTVNSQSTPTSIADRALTTSINQTKNVFISGISVEAPGDYTCFDLDNITDSVINDIKLQGNWSTGTTIVDASIGIKLSGLSSVVTSSRNQFNNIEIDGFSYGVRSNNDVSYNDFQYCKLQSLGYGIVLGDTADGVTVGEQTGPTHNSISKSIFSDIDRHGFWVGLGKYNQSSHNRYIDIGNDSSTDTNAEYPCIRFNSAGNDSTDDHLVRFDNLAYDPSIINTGTDPFVPDITGDVISEQGFFHKLTISENAFKVPLFRLPADMDKTYEINYIYRSNVVDAIRKGTLTIMVDTSTESTNVIDDYNYEGNPSYITDISFDTIMRDEDGDSIDETVIVRYDNTTTSDTGNFLFKVKTFSVN